MSRLKKCFCDDTEPYLDFLIYKPCRKCKHRLTKSKTICRINFMWFHNQEEHTYPLCLSHKRKARQRVRMIAKYFILYEKIYARKEIKHQTEEFGYLPTRKEIAEMEEVNADMAREWSYLEAGIRGVY